MAILKIFEQKIVFSSSKRASIRQEIQKVLMEVDCFFVMDFNNHRESKHSPYNYICVDEIISHWYVSGGFGLIVPPPNIFQYTVNLRTVFKYKLHAMVGEK